MINNVFKWSFGSFFRTLGRILAYLTIGFLAFYFFSEKPKAEVFLNGEKFTGSNFIVVDSGNRVVNNWADFVVPDNKIIRYYNMTFCTDSNNITNWFLNSASGGQKYGRSLNIYNTSTKCQFPNSTYAGGHIVYMYGELNLATDCGASGTNCVPHVLLTYYQPNYSSWALLSSTFSESPYSIDYSQDTIINQNKELLDQTGHIIKGQTDINNSINKGTSDIIKNQDKNHKEAEATRKGIFAKLKDLFNLFNNGDIDNPKGDIDNAKGSLADEGPITSLFVLPVKLYTNIANNINGTCNEFNLGTLLGTELKMPCIDLKSRLGAAIYTSIDLIISGFAIYHISKKFVIVFDGLSELRGGDIM